MREICTLRAMRRELETWPRENCEPTEQSKELDWKPSPYSARASSRPYWEDHVKAQASLGCNRNVMPPLVQAC